MGWRNNLTHQHLGGIQSHETSKDHQEIEGK